MTTFISIALLIIIAALIFGAGFLVGRNNPKREGRAIKLTDSAVEKAKEKAKD
ncbi:MAG: hypothetical protein H6Q52_1766 [Deltaproteobacteria bacterium]|nr:hypothetical protein [Deltaproteobacteria bacterium]